jgi:hypothetical protein
MSTAFILFLLGTFFWCTYAYVPVGVDWAESFQPAALKLITGHSPYEVTSFFNAPWVLIPLIPFAVLPTHVGFALWFVTSFCLLAYLCHKFGANLYSLIAFLFSFPIVYNLFFGQIDALIAIGFLLPQPIGIFLLLAKPQIGIGVVIFWTITAWREGRLRRMIRLLLPVTLAFGISFLLYGAWYLNVSSPIGKDWDTAFWPKSIPIGLALLAYAIQKKSAGPSIAASPFLSPYCGCQSWAVSLLGMLPNHWVVIAGSVGTWIMLLLNGWWKP